MEYVELKKVIEDLYRKSEPIEELIAKLWVKLDRGEIPLDTARVKLYNYLSRLSKLLHDKEEEVKL